MLLRSSKPKVYLLALGLVLAITGCRKDDEPKPGSDFDRSALLTSYADELIIPAYEAHQAHLEALVVALSLLEEDLSTNHLEVARTALHEAWLSWQEVALYDFGPASDHALLFASNIYPVDTARIQENIAALEFDLGSAQNLDAIGFPALDFILYGAEMSDQEVLDSLVPETGHLAYALAVANYMRTQQVEVLNAWDNEGGNYRETFISATGVDVGSSLGQLLNAFNRVFEEHIRKNKLGLPSGAMTFSQTPLPDHVESFYGQRSKAYILAALEGSEQFFAGGDGTGLDDYLDALGAEHHDSLLSEAVFAQLTATREAVLSLDSPLNAAVVNDQEGALQAYAEMQALVVLWKVDMMSALGVLITYQDNDGD